MTWRHLKSHTIGGIKSITIVSNSGVEKVYDFQTSERVFCMVCNTKIKTMIARVSCEECKAVVHNRCSKDHALGHAKYDNNDHGSDNTPNHFNIGSIGPRVTYHGILCEVEPYTNYVRRGWSMPSIIRCSNCQMRLKNL